MKVIFLDFDGVLNSWESIRERRLHEGALMGLDPFHVAKLQRVVDATGAEIVVSSSWRIIHPLTELRETLTKAGFRGVVRGKTRKLNVRDRCLEILDWLEDSPHDVTSYVIFDDGSDAEIAGRFVKTEMDTGLQDEHVDRAIAILERP